MIFYFLEKLGTPTNQALLEEYLFLCTTSTCNVHEYTEEHHILPQSLFPEYKNEKWNKIKVSYQTHCLLHELLWCAYPKVGEFWRPLNYMKSQTEQMRTELTDAMSIRAKHLWEEIKANPDKMNEWSEKKRKLMLERMHPTHPAYQEMKLKVQQYYETTIDAKTIRSIASKEMWADPTMREKIIAAQKQHASNPETRQQRSMAIKKRYEDVVYYEQHKLTMSHINANAEKKQKNRQTILEKWKDPDFAARMRQKIADGRKKRKSSSDAMKALWADPIKRQEMLDKRKKTQQKVSNNETE